MWSYGQNETYPLNETFWDNNQDGSANCTYLAIDANADEKANWRIGDCNTNIERRMHYVCQKMNIGK